MCVNEWPEQTCALVIHDQYVATDINFSSQNLNSNVWDAGKLGQAALLTDPEFTENFLIYVDTFFDISSMCEIYVMERMFVMLTWQQLISVDINLTYADLMISVQREPSLGLQRTIHYEIVVHCCFMHDSLVIFVYFILF